MNQEDAIGLLNFISGAFMFATLALALLVWLFVKIKDVVGTV